MADLPRDFDTAAAATPSSGENRSRIMALDYGRKRIGIALSDELRMTAQPLEVFERTNRRNDLRHLREIVRRHGVRLIVLGYPLLLDGTEGEMAREAARFAQRVSREMGVEVQLADERLTSWEAKRILGSAQNGRGNASEQDDDVAAAVLLTDFLNRSAPVAESAAPASRRMRR
jgi:putative Holliday junction resolvase